MGDHCPSWLSPRPPVVPSPWLAALYRMGHVAERLVHCLYVETDLGSD